MSHILEKIKQTYIMNTSLSGVYIEMWYRIIDNLDRIQFNVSLINPGDTFLCRCPSMWAASVFCPVQLTLQV